MLSTLSSFYHDPIQHFWCFCKKRIVLHHPPSFYSVPINTQPPLHWLEEVWYWLGGPWAHWSYWPIMWTMRKCWAADFLQPTADCKHCCWTWGCCVHCVCLYMSVYLHWVWYCCVLVSVRGLSCGFKELIGTRQTKTLFCGDISCKIVVFH